MSNTTILDRTTAELVVSQWEDVKLRATPVHGEVYRDHSILVLQQPAYRSENGSTRSATLALKVDGRYVDCPSGDLKAILKKVRASIDTDIADAELLPELQKVIRNAGKDDQLPLASSPELGSVGYVHAMGMLRRGLVTKITKTRAEIAYTTASNPTRVFRKSTSLAELVTD